MPRTLQFKRYGSATLANTIGANGELIINQTNKTLTVHDGITPGGFTLLNEAIEIDIDQYARNQANTASNNITIIQGVNSTQNTNISNASNLAQAAFDKANTALANTTGSWTVTTGANTYSFTVPSDGTYVMWVKGNITNGIIIWNATLSISNSNVPAIGTQYAWNYTGGGSPILLTTLPDQIRGTANTINTDNTYVGSTSNRFDFGISNSSGSSQTIYYGYTKI